MPTVPGELLAAYLAGGVAVVTYGVTGRRVTPAALATLAVAVVAVVPVPEIRWSVLAASYLVGLLAILTFLLWAASHRPHSSS